MSVAAVPRLHADNLSLFASIYGRTRNCSPNSTGRAFLTTLTLSVLMELIITVSMPTFYFSKMIKMP